MKTALTIAGTDPTGGAGVQADLKTFVTNGVFGMSVITSVVSQNTTGVYKIENMSAQMVESQLDAVFTDIFPDAVKIGMVSQVEIIEMIAKKLIEYKPKNIVLDPVMVATSGGKLLEDNALKCLQEKLLPLADLITPNIFEAELLSGMKITNKEDLKKAGDKIYADFKVDVLMKGGHFTDNSDDLLLHNGEYIWFESEHIQTTSNHGTGCTLSSAIAANLAKGEPMDKAVGKAKEYVKNLLKNDIKLGKGNGPLGHSHLAVK